MKASYWFLPEPFPHWTCSPAFSQAGLSLSIKLATQPTCQLTSPDIKTGKENDLRVNCITRAFGKKRYNLSRLFDVRIDCFPINIDWRTYSQKVCSSLE